MIFPTAARYAEYDVFSNTARANWARGGRETLFEAKQREWNSPTVESETAGRAADIEGILLSKLVKAPAGLTARDLMQKLSKNQRRMVPNVEAICAALDAAITAGRVTIDGDTYRLKRKD